MHRERAKLAFRRTHWLERDEPNGIEKHWPEARSRLSTG